MALFEAAQNAVEVVISFVNDPNNQMVIRQVAQQIGQVAAAGALGVGVASVGTAAVGGLINRAGQMINAGGNPLGDVTAFQQASRFVTQSMSNITDAAITLARTGFGILLAEMTALTLAAKKVAEDFVSINEKFQGLQITLQSSFKSADIAQDIREAITKITVQSPLPFEGLAELTRAIAIMPQTRGQLLAQQQAGGDLTDPNGFLRQMTTLVEKMVAFRPDKTVADAIFSIREALSGEFRSLIRRFDIPMNLVAAYSGQSVKELKTDQPATLDALQTLFGKIIDDEAVRQSVRQPSRAMQNIREQVYDIPLLRLGEAGTYDKILGILDSFKNMTSVLNKQQVDAQGKPIMGTSMVEEAAKQLSPAINSMIDKFMAMGGNMLEQLLSKAGYGADKGGTTVQRTISAVTTGVEKLSEVIPPFVERLASVIEKLVPLLAKLADLVLKFADQWLSWMDKNPITTILGSLLGFQALKSGPGLIMQAIGSIPNYSQVMGIGGSFLPASLGGTGTAGSIGTMVGQAAGFVGAATLAIGTAYFAYQSTGAIMTGLDQAGLLPKPLQTPDQQAAHESAAQTQMYGSLREALGSEQFARSLQTALKGYIDFEKAPPPTTQSVMPSGGPAYLPMTPIDTNREAALKAALGKLGINEKDLLGNLDDLTFMLNRVNSIIEQGKYKTDPGTREKTLDQLSQAFSKNVNQGGFYQSLDAAMMGNAFKSTFGASAIGSRGLEASLTSPTSAIIKQFEDTMNSTGNPSADVMKKLEAFPKVREEVMKSAQDMLDAMSKTDDLTKGQADVLVNLQRGLKTLEDGLASGKVKPEDILNSTGLSVQQMIDSYQKMIGDINSGVGGLGKTFDTARSNIQSSALSSIADLKIDAVVGSLKTITDVVAAIQKGAYIDPTVLPKMEQLIQNMDPKFLSLIQSDLNQLTTTFTDPNATSAELEKSQAKARDIQADILKKAADYVAEVYKQTMAQFPGASTGAVGYTTTNVGGVTQFKTNIKTAPPKSITRPVEPELPTGGLSGGLYTDPQLFIDPNGDLTTEVPKSTQNAANTFTNNANAVISGIDKLQGAAKFESDKLNAAAARKTDNKMLDKDIQNAISEMGVILGQVETIRNGPLSDYLQQDFQKTIEQFPALKPVAAADMSALFAQVKEGNAGLDAFYDKMKAVADFSRSFADQLQKMADAETDPSQRDKYLDAARQYNLKAAEAEQKVFDLDRSSDPFKSFSDGLEKSIGASKRSLSDLSDVGKNVGDALSRDLGNAFADFVTGTKSGKEAFAEFAKSIIGDLAKIASEAAAKQLLGLLVMGGSSLIGGGSSPTTGGNYGNLFGSATGGLGADAAPAYLAEGGLVTGGRGGIDDIPARLTAGEYVVSRDAVNRIGLSTLHAINSGGFAHFADGGFVGNADMFNPGSKPKGSSIGSTSSKGTHFSITNNFTINNDSSDDSVSKEQAREFNRVLTQKIQKEIAEQSRPGGLLSKR